MSRGKKIALGMLLTLVALGVAAAMLGPSMVRDTVETQLKERLDRRGIDAQWSEFNAGFGKRFEIKGLNVHDPKRGVKLTTDEVIVVVSIDSIIANDPRLEAIKLKNFQVEVDLAEAAKNREESAVEDPKQPNKKPSARQGFVERLLADPPAVEVDGAQLNVVSGERKVLSVSTEEASVSIDDGMLDFETTVAAKPLLDKLPEALQASVEAQLAFQLEVATGKATFEFRHPDTDRPLFSYEDKETAALRLGSIRGTGNLKNRTVDVELDYFSGRVGSSDAPAISADIPKTLAGINQDGGLKLTVVDAAFLTTPKKRGQIREIANVAKELVSSAPGGGGGGSISGGGPSAVDRVVALIERSDLQFKRVKAAVNLEGEEPDTYTKLTLLERFDATAKEGRFRAFGETAEGTFSAEAVLVPGQTVPKYLRIEVDDVNLEKIPGMPKERSKLPSRGTSGRVGGIVSGQFTLFGLPRGAGSAGPLDTASGSFDFKWQDGVIDLEGVSDDPQTDIDVSTEAEFAWQPAINEFRITNGVLKKAKLTANYSAEVLDVPLDTTFVFRAEVEPMDCQDFFLAFPRALFGPYKRAKLEGEEFAPSVYFKLPIYRPRALRLGFEDYEDICEIKELNVKKKFWPEMTIKAVAPTGPHKSVNGFPDDYDPTTRGDVYWLNRPFVKKVHDEGVSDPENVTIYVGPGTADYVPLNEMPSYVGGAMYLSEQMLFYKAPAISLSLIKKAMRLNLERGRFVYGGSTITQQLVKNLFLSRDKTLARKLKEAIISWRIIETISRDRILELYLNCIEFGPDIYGIGPAARYYFQKDARNLTAKEAIFLSMLKPAPWYGAKVIERKKSPNSGWWKERFELMYQRLIDEGMLTKDVAEAEKPYILEWDKNGKYIAPQKAEPTKKFEPIPLNLLD